MTIVRKLSKYRAGQKSEHLLFLQNVVKRVTIKLLLLDLSVTCSTTQGYINIYTAIKYSID